MKFCGASKKIVLSVILGLAIVGIAVTHLQLRVIEIETGKGQNIYYVPKSTFVKPLLLGHEAFLADLIWIRTVGYFADEVMGRGKLLYLENLIDLATDLDPRFEKVYMWAGAVVMYSGGAISKEKIYTSNRILKKGWDFIQKDPLGWKHDRNYWMIPQMIGFNYAIELRDRKKGAPYIAAAARIPGSPDLYKTWAATLYKKAGELEEGTRILEAMLAVETLQAQMENVEDETVKQRIRVRLANYYKQIYGKEAVRRVKKLEVQIQNLVREWKKTIPYVSFDLFLLLRKDFKIQSNETSENVWSMLFPLSSSLI